MEAMRNAKNNVKDSAAEEAIVLYAPQCKCCMSVCGVSCVMNTVDKFDFIIPEEKRPQMKSAIKTYKNI
eukprot:CAMPEP_0178414398 /NCGR_PEP_ID=MMETSP0689_2-20121128/23015_1 /TAXON_ID=160604 /ORGANISM="Amphidinium massartii, Strain CS-259" /LENGTH=68 /DNA_ID=CAMNT_0020035685 /DNA_START=82 /DNA_END=288 /DNA_ORIENTATION=+